MDGQGGLDSGPLIEDAEVPLSHNCQVEFSRGAAHASGWDIAVDYSSAGTWPGGYVDPGTLQWDAAYGPSPGCFFYPCRRVAWQHTDGEVGPYPRYTPGIGNGDVSRDEGITAIVRSHPKPQPKPNPRPTWERELREANHNIAVLHALLIKRKCRTVHGKHAYGACPEWARQGQAWHRRAAALERDLV